MPVKLPIANVYTVKYILVNTLTQNGFHMFSQIQKYHKINNIYLALAVELFVGQPKYVLNCNHLEVSSCVHMYTFEKTCKEDFPLKMSLL